MSHIVQTAGSYAAPVMIFIALLTLFSAIAALFAFAAAGSDPDNGSKYHHLSKMAAGSAYIGLGLDGVIASAYIDSNQLWLYILAWAFLILGGYLLRQGLRLRRNFPGQ